MRGKPELRQRAAGCLLIAIGTLTVASGGTLTRLGRPEYLYLAMSVGVAIIFSGVLLTRGGLSRQKLALLTTGESPPRSRLVALPRDVQRQVPSHGVGLDFVGQRLQELDAGGMATFCRQWSATPRESPDLDRGDALRLWQFRALLPADQQVVLDRLPLTTQSQLAELYFEIWSTERPARGA
jgi:hypothetical protein